MSTATEHELLARIDALTDSVRLMASNSPNSCAISATRWRSPAFT